MRCGCSTWNTGRRLRDRLLRPHCPARPVRRDALRQRLTSMTRFWRSAGETPGTRPACARLAGANARQLLARLGGERHEFRVGRLFGKVELRLVAQPRRPFALPPDITLVLHLDLDGVEEPCPVPERCAAGDSEGLRPELRSSEKFLRPAGFRYRLPGGRIAERIHDIGREACAAEPLPDLRPLTERDLKGRLLGTCKEPGPARNGTQSGHHVVLAEEKPELGPGGKQAVGLVDAPRHEVVDQDADVGLIPLQDEGRAREGFRRRIRACHEPLRRCLS